MKSNETLVKIKPHLMTTQSLPENRQVSSYQDQVIASLKAQAFDLAQRVRDYEDLSEQFNALKWKFQELSKDGELTTSQFNSQIETNQIDSINMVKELEYLHGVKGHL